MKVKDAISCLADVLKDKGNVELYVQTPSGDEVMEGVKYIGDENNLKIVLVPID